MDIDSRTIKVLYVEDDKATRESFTRLLSHYFDEVFIAEDGAQGFKTFLEHTDIEIIITDVKMPNMGGLTLIKKIKELEPDIQVVVVTAYNESHDILSAIDVGINHYLPKPLEAEKLSEVLENVTSAIILKKREERYRRDLEEAKEELEKKEEKLKRSLNVQKTFIASMSHEFRTPLNSIIGFIELLNNTTDLNTTQKEYAKNSLTSSRHLLSLVNDVLDISKIETGQLEMHNEEMNIEEALYEACEITKSNLKEGVDFEVDIPDIDYTVIADSVRIKQVVINLLNNAMKFTNSGKIKISLYSIDTVKKRGYIEIKFFVEDSGSGIKPDMLKKLFNPFVQAHENAIEGTGLGLYISRSITRLMDGDIKLESMYGIGTKATVVLNLKIGNKKDLTSHFEDKNFILFGNELDGFIRDRIMGYGSDILNYEENIELNDDGKDYYGFVNLDEKAIMSEADELKRKYGKLKLVGLTKIKSATSPAFIDSVISYPFTLFKISAAIKEKEESVRDDSFQDLKVLLVDDIMLNIILAREILKKKFGITPDTAKNGEEAFQKASENKYDIIFMDIKMPVMDGLEATEKIIGSGIKTYIVAMTANAYAEDRDVAYEVGMDDYITKPISTDEILRVFSKVKHG